MKASALLEGGSDQSSHGPGSFKDFYGSSQRPPSRNILMSPQVIKAPLELQYTHTHLAYTYVQLERRVHM